MKTQNVVVDTLVVSGWHPMNRLPVITGPGTLTREVNIAVMGRVTPEENTMNTMSVSGKLVKIVRATYRFLENDFVTNGMEVSNDAEILGWRPLEV